MDLGCLVAMQDRSWHSFSPPHPPVSHPHRSIVSEGYRYSLVMLAQTLLSLYELGVSGELPLFFSARGGGAM